MARELHQSDCFEIEGESARGTGVLGTLQLVAGLSGGPGVDFFTGTRFTGEGVLVIASHISVTSKTAAVFSHSLFWLLAILPALVSLAVSATAWGDIYKWTDENGVINFSNAPPPQAEKPKNVEILLKETRPTPIPNHAATPTEQALLARIDRLERQLRAQQYAAQPPAARPPTPDTNYYPQAPLPPPPPGYYGDGSYGSYPGYYPGYYYPVASSYLIYPAGTFISRPAFAHSRGGFSRGSGGFFRGSGGHGGRR